MRYFLRFGIGVLLAILLPNLVYAGTSIHFVITGPGGTQTYDCIEYELLFNSWGMATRTRNYDGEPIVSYLKYSDFNVVTFGAETTGIKDVVESEALLRYDNVVKELSIVVQTEDEFDIAVYNVNGTLVKSAMINESEVLSVADLTKGIYVAIVTNSEKTMNLKFIIK